MAITYNYTTKEIDVDASATLRSVYSDAMDVFAEAAQMDDLIPLRGDTPTLFTLINAWVFTSGSIAYLTSAALQDLAGNNIWTNIQSIGSIVAGTTLYIEQNGAVVWTSGATGHINMLLKTKDAGSEIDSQNFTVYARKFQQTYSSYAATGGAIVVPAPLATQPDINLDIAQVTIDAYTGITLTWGAIKRSAFDGTAAQKYTLNGAHNDSVTTITVNEAIDAGVPASGAIAIGTANGQEVVTYTGKGANTFTGCTRGTNSTTATAWASGDAVNTNVDDYAINLKTTGGQTLKQLYNWERSELLKAADIDDGAGTKTGKITPPTITMPGSSVITIAGTWVEGFNAADANKISYVSNGATNHNPPSTVAVTISSKAAMSGGRVSIYELAAAYDASTYTPASIVSTILATTLDGSGNASTSLVYSADKYVVVRVRKAGYKPFEVGSQITSTGLSVASVNEEDTIYVA